MDFIRASIEKPVSVIVGVILIILFGVIGLMRMPYQLSPSVTEPEITITTTWRGSTPYEIERDIIEEQEAAVGIAAEHHDTREAARANDRRMDKN